MVRNYTIDRSGYRTVPVYLDDPKMQSINMRFLVSSWGNQGPFILVSQAFMALPLTFKETGIWHEIGHIHFEHFRGLKDQTQLREARIAAVQNGQVLPQETEADRFALMRTGRDPLIRFLSLLLETRPTGGESGWNDVGRRELEFRIANIQTL